MAAPSNSIKDVRVSQTGSFNWDRTPVIRIAVSTPARVFEIHYGLLVPRSGYFQRVLGRNGQKREVRILQADPETFALYNRLLYFGTLRVKPVFGNDAKLHAEDDKEYATLCKRYDLAEMLVDQITKDLVLAAIVARSKEPNRPGCLKYPDIDCINIIYSGTSSGSPARRLMVDFYVEHATQGRIIGSYGQVHNHFVHDLATRMMSERLLPKVKQDLSDFGTAKQNVQNQRELITKLQASEKLDKTRIAQLEASIKGNSREIQQLEAGRKDDRRSIADLKAQVKSLKGKNASLEYDLSKYRSDSSSSDKKGHGSNKATADSSNWWD